MKKTVCLILCLIMLLQLLVACSGKDAGGDGNSESLSELITVPPMPETETEAPLRQTAEISDKIFYLMEEQSRALNYTLTLSDRDASEVEWISSSDCVTVKDGVVYAKKEGFAVISGGGATSCVVRVIPRELPKLSVDTGGLKPIVSKEIYLPCTIDLDASNADFDLKDISAGIRLRGNSTSSRPKKPYRIKFDSKQNLLGMHNGESYKSWVLLAEYFDNSVIRNSTCLSLASMILNEYVSDWRYVNLYIDGYYAGVYLLAEQSQIKEGRIDIEEAGADTKELLSGYLFETESSSQNPFTVLPCADYTFKDFQGVERAMRNLRYELKNDDTTPEQEEFAANYLKNVFLMLYFATYRGVYFEFDENYNVRLSQTKKTAEEAISAIIDVDSFVRKYIHSELVCNWDDHQKSYYTHVDLSENGTGLFTFSNPWDFDHAFYQYGTLKYQDPEKFFASQRTMWYVMLLNNAFIREKVVEYWNQICDDTNNFEAATEMLRTVAMSYTADFDADAELWSREKNRLQECATVYTWLETRIKWLDAQFNDPNYVK